LLKSIYLTNLLNVLMCFLVSLKRGQVSPVQIMCRILSFASCVQVRTTLLIVCSSLSPQGHIELGIIVNTWRYDRVKSWSFTI